VRGGGGAPIVLSGVREGCGVEVVIVRDVEWREWRMTGCSFSWARIRTCGPRHKENSRSTDMPCTSLDHESEGETPVHACNPDKNERTDALNVYKPAPAACPV